MVEKKRFDSKWQQDGGCWVWTGAKTGGYGAIWVGDNIQLAHRVAWCLYKGEIPDGKYVLHKNNDGSSHRRDCVNPEHLYIGTAKDNAMDMVEVGAYSKKSPCGEQHGRSKLSRDDAEEIIKLCEESDMAQQEIADMFGVSQSTVSEIKTGVKWPHLDR